MGQALSLPMILIGILIIIRSCKSITAMTRLIRYSLIFVSSVFLLWAVIFFGGASIVKSIVKFYAGNDVILNSVRVTPTLSIYVGRVEFREFEFRPQKKLSGFVRQLEFKWSLITGDALVSVKASAVNFDKKFTSEKSVLAIYRDSFWDFNNFKIAADTQSLKYGELWNAENIKINLNLNRQELKVSEVVTELTNTRATIGPDILLKDALIHLDRFDLSADFMDQFNKIEFKQMI